MSWLALYGVFVTFGIGIYIFGIFLAKNRGFFFNKLRINFEKGSLYAKKYAGWKKSSPPPVVTVVGAK